MEAYFVDTNVVIDYAMRREPFYQESKLLFRLAENQKILIGVSTTTFPTMYYLCNKMYPPNKLRILSSEMRSIVDVLAVSEDAIAWAENSNFKDLEDAIQNYVALDNGFKTIITRNKKDFKNSDLAILTPEELLMTL